MSMTRAQLTGMTSSVTPEWYTPDWLLARCHAFLGGDVYDPCARPDGTPQGLAGRAKGWPALGAARCSATRPMAARSARGRARR
ncbi:MAG TPA: hypothetical protein VFN78_12645 [Ktedonobacterales bacterium]|nr:hypothetical protein [Ktedonobacterales bacterium]